MVAFFDGHNDVLLRIHVDHGHDPDRFLQRREDGHVDLPRAREGGLAGGLFAVFVPPETEREDPLAVFERIFGGGPPYVQPLDEPIDTSYASRRAEAMVELLLAVEAASGGGVTLVRTAGDLERCIRGDGFGAVLHLEGAEPIDPGLDGLEPLYQRGLRSLGLVWSRPNAFAEGVPFRFPSSPDTGPGLTTAGRRLVRECNRLGILLDLSHLNERGFWDVARLSDAPLVASHSNAHALCQVSRNLTDAQLDEIGRSGGVVGITFLPGLLREDGRPESSTPLERVLEHVDYVVDRIGADHVAFGSDFEGAIVIDGIGDAAGLQRVVRALRDRGYGAGDIAKLTHENWLRVLHATWA